jgi:threonine dehydratase
MRLVAEVFEGSFVRLHNVIFPRAVTEFVYRYSRPEKAHVFLSFIINTSSRETEVAQVIAGLQKEGMEACDISEDELSKAHGRYMVGGCQEVEHERVFRFGQ